MAFGQTTKKAPPYRERPSFVSAVSEVTRQRLYSYDLWKQRLRNGPAAFADRETQNRLPFAMGAISFQRRMQVVAGA